MALRTLPARAPPGPGSASAGSALPESPGTDEKEVEAREVLDALYHTARPLAAGLDLPVQICRYTGSQILPGRGGGQSPERLYFEFLDRITSSRQICAKAFSEGMGHNKGA